mmetsp:Transcript_1239/g.1760  ORF Transcript_1239/g.1760 Transcript_1239/m.1760 type:complete len:229 (-) Transcript_1239:8-694(-)
MCDIITMVDASYMVHPNMRGHTGGLVSMGIGVLHGKSSKQKLNTKTSTESELVGLSEYLPYTIWFRNFFNAQGYEVSNNIIYQDNISAICMERNGRNSCTGNSRHISIRYFFVKDRVDKGEVDIKYCPTEQMLADYFTKGTQGSLFEKQKSVIMGWTSLGSFIKNITGKECVGNNILSTDDSSDVSDVTIKNNVYDKVPIQTHVKNKENNNKYIYAQIVEKNMKVSFK